MRTESRTYSIALVAALLLAGARASAEPQGAGAGAQPQAGSAFYQDPLDFAANALEPYISSETVQYHYGKHYRANVDALNKLTAGKPEAAMPLELLVMTAPPGPLFNNAAQAWNHAFYFNSLKPGGGGEPAGPLAAAIKRDFGSFAKFRETFSQAAQGLFGSGWTWLALDDGKLKVAQTADADLPMKHGQKALLVLDVWEHAYYIDYRNARPKYIDAALDHLVNWDFAGENYAEALAGRTAADR